MPGFGGGGRSDPLENFKFRVMWDGQYIAGVNKVTALRRTTQVVEEREGGDNSGPRKLPGRTTFDPITLERGITTDTAFEDWANQVFNPSGGLGSLGFRKDIAIDLFNEAGQKVRSYKVHRCWVSEYAALPNLDANGNAVAIESIRLENDGWERDLEVVPPQ